MSEAAQKDLNSTCTDQEDSMYSKTSKTSVNEECVKKDNTEHEKDSMKYVAASMGTEVMQLKLEMESASNSVVTGVRKVLDFVSNRSETELSTNKANLESSRKRLVEYLNEEMDKIKNTFEENHEKKEGILKSRRDQLSKKESKIKSLLQEIESKAPDMTDSDIKRKHEEMRSLLSEIEGLAEIPLELQERISYTPGSTDLSCIKPLLGNVDALQSSANPVLKHQFLYSGSTIKSIFPITEDQAWIHAEGTTMLLLVDVKGNIKRSVDLQVKCTGFAVDSNDSLYFTEFDAKRVQENDGKNVMKTISSTDPFFPSVMCLSHSGDLLICMQEKKTQPDGMQSERHFVRKLTTTGVKIKDYELEIDMVQSHKGYPWRIVEHTDGSICVLVVYNDENGSIKFSMIYCIDCSGNLKFKYSGKNDKIAFLDICCDMTGNILASDSQNRRIHIIDSKGDSVCYFNIAKRLKYLPLSIALFGNSLWTGTIGAGILQVYQYDY